jgi:hypothetical protein
VIRHPESWSIVPQQFHHSEPQPLAGVNEDSYGQGIYKRAQLKWKAKACNNEKRRCGPQKDESAFIIQSYIED